MTTYHVNPNTGRANICRAQSPASCPLKSDDETPVFHGDNKEEAKQHGLKLLENRHGELGHKVSKKETSKSYDQLQKEIEQLRKKKATITDKEEIKKINGAIRGKSIHLNKAKESSENKKQKESTVKNAPQPSVEKTTSKYALNSEVKRPKVEDVPDNAVKVFKTSNTSGMTSLSKKPKEKKISPDAALVLDKNAGINEKKEILVEHLTNPEKFKELSIRFKEQGYSLEDSEIYSAVLNNEPGVNLTLRNAIRETNDNGETTLADVLINAEEASSSQGTAFASDRFSEFTYQDSELSLDDLDDDLEDAPEFLAEDPDFAIDEDDDFNEDEQ